MAVAVETHPISTIGTRSHRDEQADAARDLRAQLGRRPTAEEFAAVRKHVAAERRAAQERARVAAGTDRQALKAAGRSTRTRRHGVSAVLDALFRPPALARFGREG